MSERKDLGADLNVGRLCRRLTAGGDGRGRVGLSGAFVYGGSPSGRRNG